MGDDVKALLDELQGFDDWVGYQQVVGRLRAVVERMWRGLEDAIDLQKVAERQRDELREKMKNARKFSVLVENAELKRRLGRAHDVNCRCRDAWVMASTSYAQKVADPRCLALRKGDVDDRSTT